jgi:hypothetical protein
MRPGSIAEFTRSLPACIVAMEACCGAHHLGRLLVAQGHTVRLMSPEYVRPYVKAQKNDDRDAEAIAEAATRPTMRFVVLKSEEQLDLQILHRARERLVGERTALINQLRAILLERGITVPKGRRKLEQYLAALPEPEEDTSVSPRIRRLIEDMRMEWRALDQGIDALDAEFTTRAREDADARRLTTIPGIGVLNATALTAAIGTGETFVDAISQPGLDWCLVRQPRAASHVCSASPNAATRICASCSSTVHEPRCQPWRVAPRHSAPGCVHSCNACTRTSLWLPWPTSWRASSGRCCGEGSRSTLPLQRSGIGWIRRKMPTGH